MAVQKTKATKVKSGRSGGTSSLLLSVMIAGFAFLIYANTIGHNYNLDDDIVTRDHKLTSQGISAIPLIFRSPYYSDEMGYKYEYRPMVLTTFAIEHQFFGENPHVSHFINVLLYALCCLLIYKTLKRLFADYSMLLPLAATALFIVHPLHTEAVASIKCRDEILTMMGAMGSLLLMLRYADTNKWYLFALSIVVFVGGILSKLSSLPMLVIIPVALTMFSQIEMRKLVLWTALAGLFTFIFLPITPTLKVVALLGVCLFSTLFYYFFHRPKIDFSGWKQLIFPQRDENQNAEIIPEAEITQGNHQWWHLVAAAFLSFIGGLSIYYNIPLLITPIVTGLLLLLLYTSGISYIFLIVSITMLIGFAAAWLNYILAFDVWMLALIYILHQGNKSIKIASLLSILFMLTYHEFNIPWHVILYPILLIASFKKNWIKYVRFIAFPLLAVVLIPSDDPSLLEPLKVLLVIITLFSYNLPLLRNRLPLNIILVPIMLIASGLLIDSNLGYSIDNEYFRRDSNLNLIAVENTPTLIPQNNRVLDFVEMPVKPEDPLTLKLGTSLYVLGKYLKLMLIPYPLGFYYGYKHIPLSTLGEPIPILVLILHLILAGLTLYFIKKQPVVSFSIAFYLLSIAIFSNLFAPAPGLMADRFGFIASLGFCLLVAYLILYFFGLHKSGTLPELRSKPIAAGIFAVLILLQSTMTIGRNTKWKDHLTLFRNDIGYLDESAQAHYLLATNLAVYAGEAESEAQRNELLNEAKVHLYKNLEIYKKSLNAWLDLGRIYAMQNDMQNAKMAFHHSVEKDSAYAEGYLGLAQVCDALGMADSAVYYYEKVVLYKPGLTDAYEQWAAIYFKNRSFDNAIIVFKMELDRFPGSYYPTLGIAKSYLTMGNKDEALIWFEKAFMIDRSDKKLGTMLAQLYYEKGNMEKVQFYARYAERPQ